jgi:secreted Zn-dependent insulinase-like peptidase
VFSFIFDQRGVYAYEFLIQSNARSCHFVQERIRVFIAGKLLDTINVLTQEKFDTAKESVKVSLLEKDYKLEQEVLRNWN